RLAQESWPVRVVVGENDIRKITFQERPNNLEELVSELKKRLSLQYNFTLHYEDPDFNNDFCNDSDITELPTRPTLKIISLESATITLLSISTSSSACDLSTASSSDTDILSQNQETSHDPWPSTFEVPYFSHDILQKLAEEMYKYMAYPQDKHFLIVAEALISKHPCLKEPGSTRACNGWKNSLKFKMGNLRAKLRQCGMADVSVNSIKKTQQNREREPSGKNIKRPRRSEANFLPNFLHGVDRSTLESSRQILENEMKKRSPNVDYVNRLMSQTFLLRRKETVEEQPSVKQMLEPWPALFRKQQVFAEFTRVASRDLEQDFFQSLDHHIPQLLEIFKSKKGAVGSTLSEILVQVERRVSIPSDFV
uniref:PB1 domain-containing protein n=1 Tax=Kryptolebias marmoratus TaxID=37003 RepID=A0A3Q3G929_KRYMA